MIFYIRHTGQTSEHYQRRCVVWLMERVHYAKLVVVYRQCTAAMNLLSTGYSQFVYAVREILTTLRYITETRRNK